MENSDEAYLFLAISFTFYNITLNAFVLPNIELVLPAPSFIGESYDTKPISITYIHVIISHQYN